MRASLNYSLCEIVIKLDGLYPPNVQCISSDTTSATAIIFLPYNVLEIVYLYKATHHIKITLPTGYLIFKS